MEYSCLNKQTFSNGSHTLVPIRLEDRYDIMRWRNEQIYHLRQNNHLTKEDQDKYFENIVVKLFDQEHPNQILFSFLEYGNCIGYGGLVHINWLDKNAEISFIMDTYLEVYRFQEIWQIFLILIQEVAFDELSLHKIYTYAFDLRPHLYDALEYSGFLREARLKDHVLIEGGIRDIVIHSKFNNNYRIRSEGKNKFGNVLISSASKKIGLVRALKDAAKRISDDIKIIAIDLNPNALSQYFADEFYVLPETIEENKIYLLNWFKDNNIRVIVPSRDGELLFWSNWKGELSSHGVSVMVSDVKSVEICLDKFAFSAFCLANKVPIIMSFLTADEVSSEYLVVKERFGAGARSMALKVNHELAKAHAKTLENAIFQPYVKGKEISVDAYVNKSGQVIGLVTRYRKIIENGESVVTETFYSEILTNELKSYIEKLNLYGHIILQLFIEDENNQLSLIECNARIGGASTLSIKAGLNSLYWFMLEAHGVAVENFLFQRMDQKLTQIRHPQDLYYYGDHF